METKVEQKLKQLSNKQLLALVQELKQTSVPADALIRDVIKGTELDTTAPMIAFVGVGQMLAHVLAERLVIAEEEIETFHSHDHPEY